MATRAPIPDDRRRRRDATKLDWAWSACDTDPRRVHDLLRTELGENRGGDGPAALHAIDGYLRFREGRPAEALGPALRAVELLGAEQTGWWHPRASWLVGAVHIDAGLVAPALDELHRTVAHAREVDDDAGRFHAHLSMGRLLASIGDYAGATASLEAAERAAGPASWSDRPRWLCIGRSELLAAEGRMEDARAALEASGVDTSGGDPSTVMVADLVQRASLAARLGLTREAEDVWRQAASANEELGRQDPALVLVEARLAALDGGRAMARRIAAAAAAGYRDADRRAPAELTALRCDLAVADGDDRAAFELLRQDEEEHVARTRRYRSLLGGRAGDTSHRHDLHREVESLRRSQAKLLAVNRRLRNLNDRAVQLSARDPLTGLYNRRQLFHEAGVLLRLARRHRRPLSVAMVDIDRFKAVNDRFLHSTGDAVLERIGELLTGGVRDSDLVGRYGGDEFVLLLPEVPAAGAAALCERIRDAIADHPWNELSAGLGVTVTIGIAEATATESAEELLHRADQRLYLAKSLGRNQVAT